MKRLLTVVCATGISLFAASSVAVIDKDIKKTKTQLNKKSKEYTKISSSIDDAAKGILSEQARIKSLDAQITGLEADVARLSNEHQQKNVEMQGVEVQKAQLETEKDELERKLAAVLAKDMSSSLVLSGTQPSGEEDIIKAQVSKNLAKSASGYANKLKAEYLKRQQSISVLETRIKQIKSSMSTLEQKKLALAQTKTERVRVIGNLQKQSQSYKARLEQIIQEQQQARAALEQLNILKKQKLSEAAAAAAARRKELQRRRAAALAAAKKSGKSPKQAMADINMNDSQFSDDVKLMGSSYQETKGARYTGRRVSAPLEGYRIVKRFGPYVDPIYKIKIHNDSVTLRSNQQDVMVKNILDGKVVFAKSVAALGNVVIVQHDGNLHTIYAHLSKIAPTVSAGKRISQGAVVGRVDRDLTFEVTKEDVPIDPMQVIE